LSEYESEDKTSTGSTLPLYTSSPFSPPPSLSPSSIDCPPSYHYNMSQLDFQTIIRQQQEQLMAMQAQILALLEGRAVVRSRGGEATKVAKSQIFDGTSLKVLGFISVCKLYIRMKLREKSVEGQIQWILSYVQRGVVDIWKENVLEDLEAEEVKYKSARKFLMEIKKEFRRGDEELVKVTELKRMEQEEQSMEEFVQDFKRVARGSRYKGHLLIEEFKRGMNGVIRRKLIEAENQPSSIEQWFKRAIVLDQNWRESRREGERLKG